MIEIILKDESIYNVEKSDIILVKDNCVEFRHYDTNNGVFAKPVTVWLDLSFVTAVIVDGTEFIPSNLTSLGDIITEYMNS